MQKPPLDGVTATVVEFFSTNGVPAKPGMPRGIGAAAGIPEIVKAVSLSITITRMVAKIRAARARRLVRDRLLSLTLRLESSVEPSRSTWGRPTAIQAANILAALGEVSTLLRREYPLIEFSYFVAGAAGADSWVNVTVADDRLTYSTLHALMRKVGAQPSRQWTRVTLTRPWWCPWGWIRSESVPINEKEWDCRDPQPSPV